MSLNANIQELALGFGKKKQADIATANLLAGIWTLNKLNAEMVSPRFITEDDAAELGKGHEFATATYKSNIDIAGKMEKYLSAEILAWAASFGLGNSVKTGTNPNFIYTCTPLNKVTAGLELPYFSYIEKIREGSSFWDKMYVGCALNAFQVDVISAPGRSASKISLDWMGSGRITDPSAITLPAKTTEKELPAGSLAITVIGVDYVTLKDIVSVSWGWKNNLDPSSGYYPGAGSQDGYGMRGRIECGAREANLKFVARMSSASAEYTKLIAGTTGTAVLTQTYDANNTYTATLQQVAIRAIDVTTVGSGIVAVSCECSPQYHATNGVLSVVAKCGVDTICE